jgi:hypothetical protein
MGFHKFIIGGIGFIASGLAFVNIDHGNLLFGKIMAGVVMGLFSYLILWGIVE